MSLSDFGKRAAISAAAAALAAGLTVGVAPTAQAAELWGGIATGPNNAWAFWKNVPTRGEAAYFGNWKYCATFTNETCKRVLLFTQCAALAGNGAAFSPAEGATLKEAEDEALADLPGGSIVYSGCNDDGTYLSIGNNGSQTTR
jgi:ABC-type sugar transport system substrate-binding protein